jgi:hypothetical protein
MSWKGEAQKIYEKRVVNDSLARLAERVDLEALPFADGELTTLARRCREAFRHPEKGRQRLDRYKAHLAKNYGTDLVATISSALVDDQQCNRL